ncbi:hypothetical protein Slin15195_G130090 [Septoria linicola]|uniref:Uncharacterized protein n=1 Tax=Septoria linicola TaxID=215465 RepID=A0A9Q9B2Z8_9PEZI|nr:hypothetical protein Slin14017_G121980 [Septoria linicola]USW59690.1 hypothetical protein Slin15195_G130090 [Septoria linicola]
MASPRYALRSQGPLPISPSSAKDDLPPIPGQEAAASGSLSTTSPTRIRINVAGTVTMESPLSGTHRLRAQMHEDAASGDDSTSRLGSDDGSRSQSPSPDDIDGGAPGPRSADPPDPDSGEDGDGGQVLGCTLCFYTLLCIIMIGTIVGIAVTYAIKTGLWASPRPLEPPLPELIPCALFPDLNRLLNSPHGLDAELRHFSFHESDYPWFKPRHNHLRQVRIAKQDLITKTLENAIAAINGTTTKSWARHFFVQQCSDIACDVAKTAAKVVDILSLDYSPDSVFRPAEADFLAKQEAYHRRLEQERDYSMNRVFILDRDHRRLEEAGGDRSMYEARIREIEDELNNQVRPQLLIKILAIVKLSCWFEAQQDQLSSIRAPFMRQMQSTAWDILTTSSSRLTAAGAIELLQSWQPLLDPDAGHQRQALASVHEDPQGQGDGILNTAASHRAAERSCARSWAEQHLSHCIGRGGVQPDSVVKYPRFWNEFFNMIPISLSAAPSTHAARSWTRYLVAPGSAEGRKWAAAMPASGEGAELRQWKRGGGVVSDVTEDTPWWPGILKWWSLGDRQASAD